MPLRATTLGCILLLALTAAPAHAQRVDAFGRKFRVAFLPSNGAEDSPHYSIVVTSPTGPAHGTLTYVASNGKKDVMIPAGGAPVVIPLDTSDLVPRNVRTAPASKRTLLLAFDVDVSVAALNTQRWSSDAFLALPDDALGDRYLVLAYPNTLDPNPAAETTRVSDFSSQFAVVAAENGTMVTIEPRAPIYGRDSTTAPFTIKLDAGEVYIAEAKGKAGVDLSGTAITATKPVAVYGGHERANVPYTKAIGRDYLAEQIPPLDYWGMSAIATPHADIGKTRPDSNIVRVMAATDGTRITVNDQPAGTLDRGAVLELPLDRAMLIAGSGPILTAEYHGSAIAEFDARRIEDTIGDPFMTIIPSPLQFDTGYAFESFGTSDFTHHYLNIVIPGAASAGIMLDDHALELADFIPVGTSGYSYAQVRVGAGEHRISAPVPFGLHVYGYGPYNSYGYVPGVVYRAEPSGVGRSTIVAGAIAMRAVPSIVHGASARLEVEMPYADEASLELYDVTGRFVREVARSIHLEKGPGVVPVDLEGLASGTYYVRLKGLRAGAVAAIQVEW